MIFLPLLALVFPGTALDDDKKAEEAFAKIEQQIRQAKAIELRFKVTGRIKRDDEDQSVEMSGCLQMKEGNKLRASLESRLGTETEVLEFVSDGKRSRAGKNDAADTPKNLNGNFAVAVSRLGILLGYLAATDEESTGADQDSDWKAQYPVRGWKTGEGENGAVSLGYSFDFEKTAVEVVLYYDPASRKPLKRVVKLKSPKKEIDITETYEGVDLGPTLPDQLFALPEK